MKEKKIHGGNVIDKGRTKKSQISEREKPKKLSAKEKAQSSFDKYKSKKSDRKQD